MPSPSVRAACRRLPSAAQARATVLPDAVYGALTSEFDPAFYARQLALPLQRFSERSRLRLLAHYITVGWREGKSPSAQFDVASYLALNPDVAAAGMEPLRHYLVHGQAEGRPLRAHTAPQADAAPLGRLARLGLTPDDVRAMAPWFDEAFYRRAWPVPALAEGEALAHYLEHGWREGRDPSPRFSTDYYLASNPDVKARGVNPLLHFVRSGRLEGRTHRFAGAWRAQWLARVQGLDARASAWRRPLPRPLCQAAELDEALAARLGDPARVAVVIALLQDRYQERVGGVQLCAQEEQRLLQAAGHAYLAINPWQPLPGLDTGVADDWLCDVSIDGHCLGTARGRDVLAVLARRLAPHRCHLVVHSLLGHHVEWIARLGEVVRFGQRLFWLHDYLSLCTGYNLLRNDLSACGAPEADSNSCRLCLHGAARPAHLERLQALFSRLSFRVIAPSATARALWTGRTQLPHASVDVLPHRTLDVRAVTRTARPTGRPLRVAFVGQPAVDKGWFVFRDLVDSLRRDTRYAWYHLGATADAHPQVTQVDVRHTPDDPQAMQEAIAAQAIDIALVLSPWPETFCLAAHEALAGGALVVALASGGHVAALVRSTGAGHLAEDEDGLLMAFRDGSLIDAVDRHRALGTAFELRSSGLSAAALGLIAKACA
ncbi:hypothetical protein [Ramlibacter sp.]|uniref:hypothetical protein n=1 Tax=Ramlibacter sp. TaxID=1917967 RepID=UPI0035B3AE42